MSVSKPTVIYWNNIPSPYVVGRFNALAARNNIDFTAWFSRPKTSRTSWQVREEEWKFPHIYLSDVPGGMPDRSRVRAMLKESSPDVLITLYADREFLKSWPAMTTYAGRHGVRVLPTYDSWVIRSPAKELVKQFLFRSIDFAKVSGPDALRQAARYGVGPDNCHIVTQSIDVEHYAQAVDVTPDRRHAMKSQYGLKDYVFIYVGRLDLTKGVDVLIKAFSSVREQRDDVSLLILGTGPDRDELQELATKTRDIHFLGFIQRDDIVDWYGVSDAFVFPTLGDPNGVVVEEAMAASLPVISSNAAGDITSRVIQNETGFVVPAGNQVALAARMAWIAEHPEISAAMGTLGHHLCRTRSHDRYAEEFERLVADVLAKRRRRNPATLLMRTVGTFI